MLNSKTIVLGRINYSLPSTPIRVEIQEIDHGTEPIQVRTHHQPRQKLFLEYVEESITLIRKRLICKM